MLSPKEKKVFEEKKRRLETQLAGAKKVLDEMPVEIKEELRRISFKLGIRDIIGGKLKCEEVQKTPLTSDEHRLFRTFYELILAKAEDRHQLREAESLLYPKKGRPKGRRNEQPKPPDPTIAAAMEYRKTPEGRKLKLMQLAQKHSGGKTRAEWKKWIYRFNKANSKTRRSRS